jgi:UDPglucose--hexose-1-phosphate uridylyltransferase
VHPPVTIELRKDEAKDILIVCNTERAKRPVVLGDSPKDPFGHGAEKETPDQTYAAPPDEEWRVRAFKNRFPIFNGGGTYDPGHFPTYPQGFHEVIVETPNMGQRWHEADDEQLRFILGAYRSRLADLQNRPGVAYVMLFKNHGARAGASVDHEHAQVVALPFVPPILAKEAAYDTKLRQETGKGYLDTVLEKDGQAFRLAENPHAIALAPCCARFPLECWVIPKRDVRSLLDLTDEEAMAFLRLLRGMVRRVERYETDYCLAFHNGPKDSGLRFHVEVYPRHNVWAGLEMGAGIIVNTRDQQQTLEMLGRDE